MSDRALVHAALGPGHLNIFHQRPLRYTIGVGHDYICGAHVEPIIDCY